MINLIFKNKKSGFVVLETILYICFFALLSIVVINAMITMMKSFKETKTQSELVQGSNILETITREIRQANSIDVASTATDLKLNSKDYSGNTKTMEFKLLNSNILLKDGANAFVNLNGSNISVSSVNFSYITTLKGTAVKVVLTVASTHDLQNRVESFQDTIILRGDY